ncbi:MAG: SAM-dependent methyltransferase protein [Rhodoferax sp.]|nr:SAM-dependent methyltransferase protein [Rhodoferax sp.]
MPETRFGKWFLQTENWAEHVLERALVDLDRLIPTRRASYPVVVDVGCGSGRSLAKLQARFKPQRLVGVDIDDEMIGLSAARLAHDGLQAELKQGSSARLPLDDASVDMVFCHQTFHHLVEQEEALRDFFRVLKPGGVLLFAESTRRYIESWIILLLFRHPMQVQRTAPEYLRMVRDAGFDVRPEAVSHPYLWWSRPDLGFMERALGVRPAQEREETLINLVAVKPG